MKNLGKFSLILVLFCTLMVPGLHAELPVIAKEQLADSIQLQENRIQAFQVKYRLTGGQFKDTEPGGKELAPDVVIDCEYAHDIRKGHRYLHEKWVTRSDGEELERKYACDGKTGTKLSLKQPGSRGIMFGTIMPGVPMMLDDQAIWKPELGGYGFIELRKYGCDSLSSAIRNAKRLELASEQLETEQVYRVEFVLEGEKEKIVDPAGKTHWFTKDGVFVTWLSPDKGFCPVKIARLRGEGGDVIGSCTASDFRQISPGVWFPHFLEWPGRSRGRTIEIETIATNEKASVISRLEFPFGTHVTNKIWQVKYRVGGGLLAVKFAGFPTAIIPYLVLVVLAISGLFGFVRYRRRRKQPSGDLPQ
jgi:hypothetical protein